MSFILDALKKSETERQQQSGAEFASVPTSAPAPRRNLWVWLLVLLLAVNLAVLLGILLRPAPETPAVAASTIAPEPEPRIVPLERTEPTFVERIETAKQQLPVAVSDSAASGRDEPASRPAGSGAPDAEESSPPAPAQRIPTIDELRLAGLIDIPDLRIDIHVYSDNPAERFVFINMNKQREQTRLPDGALVREIRPDGVVLEHRGRAFLLPRE